METSIQQPDQDTKDLNPGSLVSTQLIELIDDAVLLTKYGIDTDDISNPKTLECLLVLQN